MGDKIDIEILEDGTMKADTDPISQAFHGSAEGFLRQMAADLGGDSKRLKRGELAKEDKVKLKQ